MPSNRVKVVVRCEDLQQRCFIYRFLIEKGIEGHDINIKNSPNGKGAATQWVLQQYPIEVQALRSGPRASKSFISIIDADNCNVIDRKCQHDEVLKTSNQEPRGDNERIAIVVPKRNIETWIHYLDPSHGDVQPINEMDEYPKFRRNERKCAPAAEEFARRCPNNITANDLDSLRDGCAELQRIFL
jgi:hypothetical protein